jgi:gas vesicle protein
VSASLLAVPRQNQIFRVHSSGEVAIMKVGKYEVAESKSNVGTAVTFLMIGIGAGALVALLLAPKTGKQMRRDLRRRIDDARESLEDFTEDAKDRIQDAKGKLQDAVERGSDWAEELRDTAREKAKPLRSALRRD